MRVKSILLILALLCAAALFITPFLSDYGAFRGLDGAVAYIDHLDIWQSRDPITFVTYTIGDIFCPQIESRSFILNGSQMAFCSRDVSILLGAVIGCVISFVRPNLPIRNSLIFLGISFALMIADWAFQHFSGIDLMATRVITGILFGCAVASVICSFSDIVSPPQ